MVYIRIESSNHSKPIGEKQWLEALLSIRAVRPISTERMAQLRAQDPDLAPMPGDAEAQHPDGSWHYCIQWIPAVGTALLSADDGVVEHGHWLRVIIGELAKKLDAVALDDDELHYEA